MAERKEREQDMRETGVNLSQTLIDLKDELLQTQKRVAVSGGLAIFAAAAQPVALVVLVPEYVRQVRKLVHLDDQRISIASDETVPAEDQLRQ